MPKSSSENSIRRNKSIKNIYIQKISSLLKIMGDSQSSLPCLNKARKTISSQSKEELLFQRKENNKDAARKARLRKKIYIDLLQQGIRNLQKLNQLGKQLEKSSNEVLASFSSLKQIKQQDEIDQYLMQMEPQKVKKDISQATIDQQKSCQLKRIACQIQNMNLPEGWSSKNLPPFQPNSENSHLVSRMQIIHDQLPQIYENLKSICSEHNSVLALSSSSKNSFNFDPYFGKTFMEEYYSKTICKKNVQSTETYKDMCMLVKMQNYNIRATQIEQSNNIQQM